MPVDQSWLESLLLMALAIQWLLAQLGQHVSLLRVGQVVLGKYCIHLYRLE